MDRTLRIPPTVLIGVAIGVITAAAYWPVIDCSFVNYDDGPYVFENTMVTGGLSWESFRWAFTTFHAANWHPLTWLSLQADASIFGNGPLGFHLTNLVLHVANAILLFAFLARATGQLWPAASVALLFGLHPIHVESVAWVSERKDVLAATFWMLGLLAYLRYVEKPSIGRYLLVMLTFAAGLLAKPMLVTFPCVLLLMDYWPLRRPRSFRWLLCEKVPLFALTAASCAVTVIAQHAGGAVQNLNRLGLGHRLDNAVVAYAIYVRKAFWPTDLAVLYPHPRNRSTVEILIACGVLAAITYTCWRLRKRLPAAAVGWAWFLGTLVPVVGLVQVGQQALADRYAYLPFIGLYIGLSWAVVGVAKKFPVWVTCVAAAGLIVLGFLLTRSQVEHWRGSITLWQHAIAVAPSATAHQNLGLALRKEGREREAVVHYQEAIRLGLGFSDPGTHNNLGVLLLETGDPAGAETAFRRAIELDPQFALARANLGLTLVRKMNWEEAASQLERAIRDDPEKADPRINYGLVLEHAGRNTEAVGSYREAIRLSPESAFAHTNLGSVLGRIGRYEEAVRHLTEAIRLDPSNGRTFQALAFVHQRVGQDAKALECLNEAVRLTPGSSDWRAESARVLQRLGRTQEAREQEREATRLDPQWPVRQARQAWRLATHPDPLERDGRVAVLLAEQLCRLTWYREPDLLDALAAAYASVDRYREAVVKCDQAAALARARQLQSFAAQIEARRELYRANRPFLDASLAKE